MKSHFSIVGTFFFRKKNMKRIVKLLAISLVFLSACKAFSKDTESAEEKDLYDYNNIVANINEVKAPEVLDDYIVFTAKGEARFVGIAFDFENYKILHPYERHVLRNIDGTSRDEILFFMLERLAHLTEINYRLVIDGLWTEDPENRLSRYDEKTGLVISRVEIGEKLPENTNSLNQDGVKFVYRGESGLQVRLSGTFTSWDSWIYELTETEPGFYEITLPLPRGKYYYNYFIGMTSLVDKTNPDRAYTDDGRISSVITVN